MAEVNFLDVLGDIADSHVPDPSARIALIADVMEALRDGLDGFHARDARMGYDDERCVSCQEESWPCPTARWLGLDDQ